MKKILFCSVFLLCSFFIGCKVKNDIEFSKDFFEKLVDGKASVMNDIDWYNFSGTGFDIGGKLKNISDNSEKNILKKSFINSFSDYFKKSGLKSNNLSDWLVEDTNSFRSIISAEIESGIFLYIVVNKKDGRKISSIVISNKDFKLPGEFFSYSGSKYSANYLFNLWFPQSLIDKNIRIKKDKEAELIKQKGYNKRISADKILPSGNIMSVDYSVKPDQTVEIFDTNGYLKKTIIYNGNNGEIREEKEYDSTTKLSVKKSTIKLVDEKKGLYEEIENYGQIYYYVMIDSLHYQINKHHNKDDISIYKYNKNGNLINIFNVDDNGNYNGIVSFFYDSSGNVSRRISYLNNGILNDSLYDAKYDSSGKILESVRYYAPGTFDKDFYIFYKCNSKYDLKGNIMERIFTSIFEFDDKITYTYNSKNNITKIYYYGGFGPLFDEYPIDREYKYNDDGLLIETVDTGGDVIICTIVTKYTYK